MLDRCHVVGLYICRYRTGSDAYRSHCRCSVRHADSAGSVSNRGGTPRCFNDYGYCLVRGADERPLRLYIDEMPVPGAALDLYYPSEFEVVEYFHGIAAVRMYTTHFLERLAKGKTHISPTLN